MSNGPDGTVVFFLAGDLDGRSASMVETWVESAVAAGSRELVLDLRDVAAVDAEGLWALVVANADAARSGAGLRLRLPSKRLQDLLMMTGFDQVLTIEN